MIKVNVVHSGSWVRLVLFSLLVYCLASLAVWRPCLKEQEKVGGGWGEGQEERGRVDSASHQRTKVEVKATRGDMTQEMRTKKKRPQPKRRPTPN